MKSVPGVGKRADVMGVLMKRFAALVVTSLTTLLGLGAPAGATTIITAGFNTASCGSTATASQNKCTSVAGVANTGNGLTLGESSLTFSANSGDTTLKMMVTAWQVKQSDNSIVAANIGLYNGGGLGVTGTVGSNDSAGANNLHAFDNVGGYTDFVLLQFNRDVQLSTASLNVYAINSVKDSDLSWYNNTVAPYVVPAGAAWNSYLNLTAGAGANSTSVWTNVCGADTNGSRSLTNSTPLGCGAAGATTTALNTANIAFSKIWLVSASQLATTDRDDGFKLSALTVRVTAPVPEPATWAMMIAGFGVIGWSLRRRRALTPLAA